MAAAKIEPQASVLLERPHVKEIAISGIALRGLTE
jgi:hypothetical protein